MKILIDNGHGYNTPGKTSPDGKLKEWEYTRRVADFLKWNLESHGLQSRRIVTENFDVSLAERCRRVNETARRERCLLVSLHCNAYGDGTSWHDARGFSVFVSRNASKSSHHLASGVMQCADDMGWTTRRPMPKRDFWIMDLAICRDTLCPAILVEMFFMDNRDDYDFLMSESGKWELTDVITYGIRKYLNR